MKQITLVFAVVAAVVQTALADAVKYDPRMAQEKAVVDTNGVKWIDGRYLPIEGRMYNDVDDWYDRLPSGVTTSVNEGVRKMKHHTTGMLYRFSTNSKSLQFQWTPYNKSLQMDHMPATGVSGIDVYRFDAQRKRWLYVKTGRIHKAEGGFLKIPWTPGTPCLVNLPLYNGLKSFSLGIDKDATVSALPPRASGVNKPVVFYGTSITHGGCASRPGLSFVNIVGRDLDVPVVNLGFSGSGRMEFEMSEHLARIDASCFVLDCLWNMNLKMTQDRYEKFIRNLRAKRPDVPIVMAARCDVYCTPASKQDRFTEELYRKLKAEGWKKLHFLPKDEMFDDSFEGTVDGCHPNDLGMMTMARAYGKAVKKAIGL